MAYIPGMQVHAPVAAPGWYRPTEGSVRWWDGKRWSGSFLDPAGVPVTDVWTGHVAAPRMVVAAVLYAVIAVLDLGISWLVASLGSFPVLLPVGLMFAGLAVYYGMLAFRAKQRDRIPAPLSQPLLLPQVRPLPGDTEGPGAGWYPAPTQVQLRWWTGARWAEYVVAQGRYLPSYGFAEIRRRNDVFMKWLLVGGLIALGIAVVLLVFAISTGLEALWWTMFWFGLAGVCTSVVTAIAWPIMRAQARRTGIPVAPPSGYPAQAMAPG